MQKWWRLSKNCLLMNNRCWEAESIHFSSSHMVNKYAHTLLLKAYARVNQKFCNMLVRAIVSSTNIMWLKQFKPWKVPTVVGCIIVAVALTYCALFHSVCNLKDAQINVQCTGWNDKIVALEKTTWFQFRLMKTVFLFLFQTIN